MVIKLWKDKEDGSPGHPTPKQRQFWFEQLPAAGTDECQCPACQKSFALRDIEPHQHDLDVICVLGATGAGKTYGVVRRFVWLARKYPGCKLAVCSINFSHIVRTILQDYGDFFTDPITGEKWKHPWLIGGKPNQNRKYIRINNGKGKPVSEIHFLNLEQYTQVLGTQFDAVHMEEAQNIKAADPIELLVTRLRHDKIPRKQIILTGNPTEELGWIVDWFELNQLNEDTGDPIKPIGKACFCHKCHRCRSKINKVGGDEANAPNYIEGMCPDCGYKRRGTCPGRQHFQRVVEVSADDNFENLPEGYQGNIFSMLRADQAKRLGQGKYVKKVTGLCYGPFGRENVIFDDKFDGKIIRANQRELDLNRDIIWHMDFNERPFCSGVSQFEMIEKLTHVFTIDEIIEWDKRAVEWAEAFIEKYKDIRNDFKKRILIYGDPSGHQGERQKKENRANFFQIWKTLKAAGWRAQVVQPKTVYYVKNRIKSVNNLIRNTDGLVRWHVNERCEFHILSAEKTEWDNKGEKERDNIDIQARNKGKPGQKWGLTHPMAGFGYMVEHEFPETPHGIVGGSRPVIVSTGTGVVTEMDNEGNMVVRRMNSVLDDEDDEVDNDDDDDIEDSELDLEEAEIRQEMMYGESRVQLLGTRQQSLADHLRRMGMWNMPRQ